MAWCIGWIVSGIALAATGLLNMDRYVPKMGTAWNMRNGEVLGVPYPLVLALAACLMVGGIARLMHEYDKQELSPPSR
jgi:hypothetical protein